MRKYWKFIAIIAVIVLSIGTFYVNVAMSAEQYPEFVIQTQSGDADEIKDVVLDGSYTDTSTRSYVSSNVKISADGSAYNNRSFLSQVIGQPQASIKGLQDNYRSFMRAKIPSVNLFFENSESLAYANVDYKFGSVGSTDFTFDISVLNKEDGSTNSFTMKVPDGDTLDHVFVEDVQMVDDELNVITQNMMRNGDNFYDEKHVYTIDLANQKISNHEAIIRFNQGQENTNIDARLIGRGPIKTNEHLVILKTEIKIVEEMESTRGEEINKELISYNLATKEKEKINVPDHLNLKENEISFFDGSMIYFTKLDGQELVVTPYSLVDEQVGGAFSVQLPYEKDQQPPMITVKDGKIFAVDSRMTAQLDARMIVADVKTGETLFEGQLALEDSSEEMNSFELYLHEIFVK